ncbi:phage portal protein [Microbacterium sp. cx-55]|uniref:phage portal protein n=1 Tax=Microbacterium sp. cx-55 TaxID=2875948 RepID=UPI001CBCFC92|nr:phage portal protein [Microbacterium sp. cx-55]MBZ4485994.1 phage portal protein [Microbacterium sp. cx-55]UGB34132.1 phage portal protein [Microbacterium sp. cx-55]
MGLGNFFATGYWNEPVIQRADEPAPEILPGVLPPARSYFDRGVGSDEALGLSTIFRAVQIHSTSVAQLSIDVYRAGEKVENTPLWMRRPNVNSTREAFLEETVVSLALTGNAYWRITRDNQGRISNLEVLNPRDVEPQTNKAGEVVSYKYGSRETPYTLNEIQHLKFARVPGSAKGLGPIQAAQHELRGALDLNGYANNWFQDSGVPAGVLKTDQQLTPEQAEEARKRWTDSGAGGVKVLGEGLDYKSFYLSAQELQFIENQRYTVTRIASLFGVPASLLLASVEGSSQTYQNVEQEWLAYYRFSLSKYTREIETAFSDLLGRSTTTVARFNYEALLRPDTKTRYEAHKLAIDAGWMTANEVRAIEKMSPISGGDVLRPATNQPQQQEGNADA